MSSQIFNIDGKPMALIDGELVPIKTNKNNQSTTTTRKRKKRKKKEAGPMTRRKIGPQSRNTVKRDTPVEEISEDGISLKTLSKLMLLLTLILCLALIGWDATR